MESPPGTMVQGTLRPVDLLDGCCDDCFSLLRSYNINKLAEQAVEEVLATGKRAASGV